MFFLLVVLFGFFFLKRYAFVPPALLVAWPYTAVGLSYVFFRVLHLVIDAGQGVLTRAPNLTLYLNYTMNFTALVSGPIQRYPEYQWFEQDIRLPLDVIALGRAAERIILGFFKVMVISSLLLKWHQDVVSHLAADLPFLSRAADYALISAIYPVFLYANFSGYTDVVIGIARLYRIRLPENFKAPFIAENFIAFWGRWHITLSTWLKTYVYTPLLMSLMRYVRAERAEPYFGVFAYFVTFFLVGAWHGQNSMFLVFGLLQGGGVAANKLYQIGMTISLTRKGYRTLATNVLYKALMRALTFTWFAFTLLWFWSDWDQMRNLAAKTGVGAILTGWVMVFGAAVVILSALQASYVYVRSLGLSRSPKSTRYWRTVKTTAMAITIISSAVILQSPAPDIVYKNF